MSESRQRVTVAGLGLMGAAIARGLLRAGHQVTVWNRTYSKTEGLAEHGADAVRDLAEAIVASTVVLVCVLDYPVMVELLDALRAFPAAVAGGLLRHAALGHVATRRHTCPHRDRR